MFGKFETDGFVTIVTRFGDYLIIYSNLTNPKVDKGQMIAAGTDLGFARREIDGNVYLDFHIWKKNKSISPEKWFNW